MNVTKRSIMASFVACGVLLSLTTGAAAGDELWSRAFMGTPSSGPFRPFNVVILESVTGNHLRATCSFANYSGESESPPPVTILGVKKDGKFYPHVFAKVTNDVNGEWKTIGELGVRGRRASRTVAGKTVDDNLTVQLDAFRPLIRTFVYASLVLPTGEAAVFELNDLLPPEQTAKPTNARVELRARRSNHSRVTTSQAAPSRTLAVISNAARLTSDAVPLGDPLQQYQVVNDQLSPTEQKIVGAWSRTCIEGVGRIIFTADYKVKAGFPPDDKDGQRIDDHEFDIVQAGKWRLEGEVLITAMDNRPLINILEDLDPSNVPPLEKKVERRKIDKIDGNRIVFDNGYSLDRVEF